MSTDAEAQSAISMFHGKDFNGRNLTVNEAKPMAPRAPRSGNGGGFRRGSGGGNWQ
jgi:RNA recognition motif-containing protein